MHLTLYLCFHNHPISIITMVRSSSFLTLLLTSWLATNNTLAAAPDQHEMCESWAMRGECEINPNYMLVNCASACEAHAKSGSEEVAKEIAHLDSVFDLKAKDIDGNVVDFAQLRGQVTIVTNVASYCGRTDAHYTELVKLYKNFAGLSPVPVNVLAFPCNQFGQQEPGSAEDIKQFAAEYGVTFTMMEKIDVNGRGANLVYKYLKHKTDIDTIHWNFDTYFLISPDGSVEAYNEIEPMELMDPVIALASGDEL